MVRAMQPMLNIAVRAALSAGKILTRYFEHTDSLKVDSKGRNDFVSEVDRTAEQEIIQIIRKAYPDHAILAEESGASGDSHTSWIIDPLDGTTNYLFGVPQFSVSIAVKQSGNLLAGVVYDPLRNELFTASRGRGAQLNDRRIRINKKDRLNGALIGTGIPYRDHRYLDAYTDMMKDFIRSDIAGIRRPGSAALDFSWLAAGRFDGFWELGLAPWDFAAGALLVREAGGVVTDLAGGERYFDRGNVVAANPRLQTHMLRTIQPHLSDSLSY